MREYSAISVSAADADSLAAKLTEQSRQGWELVDIVRTDDRVVAYLDREGSTSDSSQATPPDGIAMSSGDSASAAQAGIASGADAASAPPGGYAAVDTTIAAIDDQGNAVIADQTTVMPTAAADELSGGSGWASAATGAAAGAAGAAAATADSASDKAQDSVSDAVGDAADSASQHAATVADNASAAADQATSAVASADGSALAGDQGSQSSDASSGGLAPAGWYGDPAGRFDLRYWDGSQWTEHVARGGQQDTDPPVRGS